MIASLPMYDLPPVQAANDRLWALIRDELRRAGLAAPDTLTRGLDDMFSHWLSPELLLSQTCGMPYRTRLHGKVTLIGTPDYGVTGCGAGYYRSVFLAHTDDARASIEAFDGADMAYNEPISQSGWAAPLTHAARLGITLRPTLHTHGHVRSMIAVADGGATLASLDAVTWDLLRDYHPSAAQIKVVGMTDPTPGLPFIAAGGMDAAVLFRAISTAIAALSAADRSATRMRGIVAISPQAYLAVPTPPAA